MSRRTLATRIVLWALAVLLIPQADASAVDIVGQTTANLTWTAASGPVAGYGVYISRNGGSSFPGTPSLTTQSTTTTITATVGESLMVKVAAYDAAGVYGPMSPLSDVMNFVAGTPAAAIALSAASSSVSVVQGASPASTSFTVRNSGGGTLSYSISDNQTWLTVSPTSGTSTGESDTITLSYSTGSLAAGSYAAAVTVSATGLASQTHTVNLTVTAAPTPAAITLSTASMTASAVQGASPAAASFTVRNSGGGTLSYSISDNQSWLSLSPASGTATTETDTIGVTFATTALAAGSYTATITVAGGSGVTSKTVAVALTITAPPAAITLSTASMTATAALGASPAAQSFTVRNSGGGTLSYSISDNQSWLSLSPTTGTATTETDTIAVTFATTALAAGSYSATITVAGGSGVTSRTVAVALTISVPPAAITLSTVAMTATAALGASPAAASFTVRNSGGGTLSYSISDNQSWLSLSPASGTATTETDTIGVTFATTALAAGTHGATITVSGGSGVASQTIAVTVTISAAATPVISVSRTSIAVTTKPGRNPAGQTFTIRNAGVGTLTYSISDNKTWMGVTPASGTATTETDTITVTFPSNSLGVGTYSGTVTVSGGTGVSPVTIAVVMTITNNPVIALSKTLLSPQAGQGANPAGESFSVRNTGGGTLSWSISDNVAWLSVSPVSGTGAGENDTVTVSYSAKALAVGSYTGTITVAGGEGVTSQVVTVALTITTPPILSSSASTVTASSTPGVSPASQSLTIQNTGAGSMSWTISESISWLSVTPFTGSSSGEADAVTINFASTSLVAGTYTGNITVTAAGAVNSPMTIPVTLTVGGAAAIGLTTTSLSTSTVQGQNPAGQSVGVRNAGTGTLSYAVSTSTPWLSVTPASGTATIETDTIAVTYSTAALAAGTHTGSISIAGAGVASQIVSVTLTVAPAIDLDFSGNGPQYSVGFGDFDGDGRQDLAIQDDRARFWVARSTGTTFETPSVWIQHGPSVPGQMQYADVTGDEKDDALYFDSSRSGGVWVSVSTGSGFTAPTSWASFGASTPDQVQYHDVNGDGRRDLLYFDAGRTNEVFVGLSTGTGFTAPTSWLRHGASEIAMMQYSDVNGDGRADALYFDSSRSNGVWVSLSTGSGFTTPVNWLQHGASATDMIRYADVDGDGRADALYFDVWRSKAVWVSLSTGSSFTSPSSWLQHGDSTTNMLQYADVNGDGRADALYYDVNRSHAIWVSPSLEHQFSTPSEWLLVQTTADANAVFYVDVNGDSRRDCVILRGDNRAEIHLSSGFGWASPIVWPAS